MLPSIHVRGVEHLLVAVHPPRARCACHGQSGESHLHPSSVIIIITQHQHNHPHQSSACMPPHVAGIDSTVCSHLASPSARQRMRSIIPCRTQAQALIMPAPLGERLDARERTDRAGHGSSLSARHHGMRRRFLRRRRGRRQQGGALRALPEGRALAREGMG